ncbi:MAG: LysR family transcriptional regulator [Clostridiales Family XIII bacterium]|nr:LysR family transcriptional regulator [Clostridiales Family XIII bacterium]
MNIEYLKYVLEVDRAGSISKAAENLFMRQPNLSKAIKELELTLNITIFNRTFKGVEITPKGREFLRYAKNILMQYEELEALGREDNSDVQSLRLSVPRASYVVDAFTTLLSGLDATKPIHIDFFETNALLSIRHVTDGVSDIGVVRCKTDFQNYFTSMFQENNLIWRPLLEFDYLLLMSEKHPLARKDIVDGKDLHHYTEIIHGDTAMPHLPASITETERDPTPGNKKVRVYERGSQFDILSRIKDTYMWVSPMPEDLLTRNGLVQKYCTHSSRFNDIMIRRDNYELNDLEKDFIFRLDYIVTNILSVDAIGA